MILTIKDKYALILKVAQDNKCNEFHITPVLTYAWYNGVSIKGKSLAFEWGKWILLFGVGVTINNNQITNN
jgi:hypothetical protein